MIEYTLMNKLILELKIYCGPDKFYGRSKFGQYDEVKNRAPSVVMLSIAEPPYFVFTAVDFLVNTLNQMLKL